MMTRAPEGPIPNTRRAGDDRGVVAVFVALTMVVVLLLTALAIDGGVAYQSHRQSQNASDSGAMAGVRTLEQLKFWTLCSSPVVAPCTGFTGMSSMKTEIMREAVASGADAAGVTCYLLDGTAARVGSEFCSSGTVPDNALRNVASGVEVSATRTRETYFAKAAANVSQTKATTTAKAFVYNFAGGTGSPFIVCGTQDTMPVPAPSNPLDWSYNIITNTGGSWQMVNPTPVGYYYQLQGSSNPSCGVDSNTFKGKGGPNTIGTLPYVSGIGPGNGNDGNIQLTVAGLTPCPTGATSYNGCGMLIPIASVGSGSSQSTATMTLVAWLAFQVWGSGSGYSPAGSTTDLPGTSCKVAISPSSTNTMKYCGRLLGAVSVTGGAGAGPGTDGQPHILKLSQ
jgi:hypothetical protein